MSRARRAAASDAALVRRTAARIAVQAAALVALTVVVLTLLAGVLEVRQQRAATDALMHQAIQSADDVTDPPSGTWLALRRADGTQVATPGVPAGLPVDADLARVAANGGAVQHDVTRNEHNYRVRTERRGSQTVQAILSLRSNQQEQDHLVVALLVVGVVGLLLAGLVGAALARRAVRPLVDALALQREFVADASHELRTPLTLLSTRAQLLRRTLQARRAEPAVLADAEGVVRDTSRLIHIVEDLLLSADPRTYDERRACDLVALCHEVAESARDYAADRGVAVHVVEGDDHDEVRASVNAVAVRRAITALVDNAITHTPQGGTVRLDARRDGRGCVVDVSDTGPGLSPGAEARIFDRFHSGSHRAGRRGYGLGLSLAQTVAVRHDGSLAVADSGPDGTTFRLRLPGR